MFHGHFHVILIHIYKLKQYQTFLTKPVFGAIHVILFHTKRKKKIIITNLLD